MVYVEVVAVVAVVAMVSAFRVALLVGRLLHFGHSPLCSRCSVDRDG
jgi:hypothetical protein